MLLVLLDVTIYTTDSMFSDSTATFSAVTCVVFRAKMCNEGAVALSTGTPSYSTDYVIYLEASTHTQFGAGSKIYAKYNKTTLCLKRCKQFIKLKLLLASLLTFLQPLLFSSVEPLATRYRCDDQ